MITVFYEACDGSHLTVQYEALQEASEFAVAYVGERPEIGWGYAVSGDGVGKITVEGVELHDLFPSLKPNAHDCNGCARTGQCNFTTRQACDLAGGFRREVEATTHNE